MMEIWKDIEGYEGYYKVSNTGKVIGLKRTIICKDGKPQTIPERFMSSFLNEKGYACVILSKNNIRKKCKLHRLVATAFVDNPDSKKEVNHIDGNKLNNVPENLEWVTRSENVVHAYENRLQKKTYHKVMPVANMTDGKQFRSINSASMFYGIDRKKIKNSCVTGETTRVGAFSFSV